MNEYLSAMTVPLILCAVGLLMLRRGQDTFASFLRGARTGLETAVRLLPTLVALVIGIRMLTASGVVEAATRLLAPLGEAIGVPAELLPLLLTRPFSGGASSAAYASLLDEVGPDSFTALCASVIMGSSDTMVYVIGVYFSSVGIRKSRYTFPAAVAVMLFCLFFSCLICRLWFKA